MSSFLDELRRPAALVITTVVCACRGQAVPLDLSMSASAVVEVPPPKASANAAPAPAPARRPFRAIAASRQHTCVLDAAGVVICWGITDAPDVQRPTDAAERAKEGAKRHRYAPRVPHVEQLEVTETAIYLRSAAGELEVANPPWPHRAYEKIGRQRPPLPPPPAELSGRFSWVHVEEAAAREGRTTGCARRAEPVPALVCWAAPAMDPVGEWSVAVHPEVADARDALADKNGEPERVVLGTGRVASSDRPGCTSAACWKEERGVSKVKQLAGPCVLHDDGGVSCDEADRYRSIPGFGKVAWLRTPNPTSFKGEVPLTQTHALGEDGVLRWRGLTGGVRPGCATRNLRYLGLIGVCDVPQVDADWPKARAVAMGRLHTCIIGVDEEVYCSGPDEALGGSPRHPTNWGAAVRVSP
jgi:hypothetical protein